MIGSRIILHTKGDIMKPIYLIDGARTAFGTFGGSLKSEQADDLGADYSKGSLENVECKRRADRSYCLW